MTLRDELYQISKEALEQGAKINDDERQRKISEYLTHKLKKIAAKGEKSCVIKLDVCIDDIYELNVTDVVDFASKNKIDYDYLRIMMPTWVKLSW